MRGLFVPLSFALFFLVLSLGEGEERKGVALLATVALLWVSEALPLSVSALLVPVGAVLTGVFTVKEAFAPFAHPVIFLFFGSFVLATALSKHRIDKLIAYKLVSLSRGNFLLTAFLLTLSTSLLSMWMSNTSTTAMMLPLALGTISALPEEERRRLYPFLLLGVAYGASVGGTATLVGSPPNGIAAEVLDLSFSDWLKKVFPLYLLLLPLLFLSLLLLFRPPLNLKVEVEEVRLSLTPERLGVALVFLLTALGWVFSGKLSALLGTGKGFEALVAVCAVIALFALRLVEWKEVKEGVSWGTLLLFGGGIALSEVMKKTGGAKLLADALVKAVGDLSPFLLVFSVVLFVVFLTEFMSNTATTALMAPVLYSIAQNLNLPPESLVLPAAVAASCAFMLPVATPPNAIVYGTGFVRQREMMKAGLFLNLLFALVISLYFSL